MGVCEKKPGFGFSSTAEEVTEGIDAHGFTAIVTGATSGIGRETARVFAKRGAHVFLAARNVESAGKVKEEILKETPEAKVDILKLDTSSLDSVRTAAKEFLALNLPLNILVNNAGISLKPFQKSADGIELTFATNYLGHFLLTNLLLDKMKDTAKESGIEGRVVNVTSNSHSTFVYKSGIRFDNLNEEKGYSKYNSYGQSKLAQVLSTRELSKHLQKEGVNITVNAVHPGPVRTNLVSHIGLFQAFLKVASFFGVAKTPEQGAAPQCYLALHPDVKGVTGKYYFQNLKERSPSKFGSDDELAKKLWDFSINLTERTTS